MSNGATPEQLNALSKPVPQAHIKSDAHGKAYVTARYVMNWLDATVGRQNWRDEYRVIAIDGMKPMVECTLLIRIDGAWVGKSDVSGEPENYSPGKSLWSNALKRAAFRWGIARELYGEGNYYVAPDTDDSPSLADEHAAPLAVAPSADDPPARDVAKLLGSEVPYKDRNWPQLRPHFIAALLAKEDVEANGRLPKVLAKMPENPTVGMVAQEFDKRARMTRAERDAYDADNSVAQSEHD
jgi:hypothetical protein